MAEPTVPPAVRAVVRTWHDDEGWGVLDSPHTPGGCWTGYAAVAIEGYRCLRPGQPVWLAWEPAEQDGFGYRAVRTWALGAEPVSAEPPGAESWDTGPGAAYTSSLTVDPDPPAADPRADLAR